MPRQVASYIPLENKKQHLENEIIIELSTKVSKKMHIFMGEH